jgi:glycosyltransferase involved in cell wall biosynthesis
MDIGFANINLGVRGSTRRLVELANHLIKRGHKVTVYLPDGQRCDWLKLDAPIKDINKMTEKNDYLIYYGHKELFPLMQKAKVKYRIYYILGIGDEQVLDKLVESKGVESIDRDGSPTVYHALHNKDTWKVFANCYALSDWIQANLNCHSWTVQGGVDHSIFKRTGKPVAYKIVGSGSKRAAEGTVELLKVLKLLKKDNKKITSELYAGRGYSQEALAGILSSADIYLDTQKWGGWNNAAAEAMSVGVPTICTDIMGNRDFCCHGYNCLIVQVDDINGMFNAVLQLLRDNTLRSGIAKAAEKTMLPYTWENAAIQMEKALEEL